MTREQAMANAIEAARQALNENQGLPGYAAMGAMAQISMAYSAIASNLPVEVDVVVALTEETE